MSVTHFTTVGHIATLPKINPIPINYKMQFLKHHSVPVVAVASNSQDTLLTSADSLGKFVFR